jgi:predicted ribosome quality control (RQC) complex YloA/Tae2 family protein
VRRLPACLPACLQDLIKHALPHDIWFHVSQLSSAHVYLRLPSGVAWDTGIPPDTLEDCAQLVKANSIEGHKLNNVEIV